MDAVLNYAVDQGWIDMDDDGYRAGSNAPTDDRPDTDLYRLFDESNELLYVGISISAIQRASQHRNRKGWWLNVKRIEIEHYETRDLALTAEYEAIISERPLHNVMHSKEHP